MPRIFINFILIDRLLEIDMKSKIVFWCFITRSLFIEPTQALHDGDDTVSLPTEAGIPDEATTADGEVVDRDTVQTSKFN